MRKITTLLILCLSLAFVGCNKDDDGAAPFTLNNENLAGTYELTFYRSVTVETTNVNNLDIVSTITEVGDTFQVDINFAADGTYTANGQYRIVTTTVVNGEETSSKSFIIDIDNESGNYSTTSSDNVFIWDGITFEVSLFNENELRIIEEEVTTFQNGDTEMYTDEFRFVRK